MFLSLSAVTDNWHSPILNCNTKTTINSINPTIWTQKTQFKSKLKKWKKKVNGHTTGHAYNIQQAQKFYLGDRRGGQGKSGWGPGLFGLVRGGHNWREIGRMDLGLTVQSEITLVFGGYVGEEWEATWERLRVRESGAARKSSSSRSRRRRRMVQIEILGYCCFHFTFFYALIWIWLLPFCYCCLLVLCILVHFTLHSTKTEPLLTCHWRSTKAWRRRRSCKTQIAFELVRYTYARMALSKNTFFFTLKFKI